MLPVHVALWWCSVTGQSHDFIEKRAWYSTDTKIVPQQTVMEKLLSTEWFKTVVY